LGQKKFTGLMEEETRRKKWGEEGYREIGARKKKDQFVIVMLGDGEWPHQGDSRKKKGIYGEEIYMERTVSRKF